MERKEREVEARMKQKKRKTKNPTHDTQEQPSEEWMVCVRRYEERTVHSFFSSHSSLSLSLWIKEWRTCLVRLNEEKKHKWMKCEQRANLSDDMKKWPKECSQIWNKAQSGRGAFNLMKKHLPLCLCFFSFGSFHAFHYNSFSTTHELFECLFSSHFLNSLPSITICKNETKEEKRKWKAWCGKGERNKDRLIATWCFLLFFFVSFSHLNDITFQTMKEREEQKKRRNEEKNSVMHASHLLCLLFHLFTLI